ncbi:MAG: hypothetical protein K2Y40_09805 [Reyranella sp.]|jgi:hypothetical protein|nr:hypothetical protein [Reyranella sp.]
MKSFVAASALAVVLGAAPAFGQGMLQSVCQQNFAVEGTARVTAMNFRTWREFPNLAQPTALKNLRAAMLAEGFSNIAVDAEAGALTAVQETSGSGRPQTLRVSARRVGNGTRIDAVFMIQAGQMADSNYVRNALCRIVDSANL